MSSAETCTGCARCRARQHSGHPGPYTPAEFTAMGVANPPPVVDVPEELVDLGIAVDVAAQRYEQARQAWGLAITAASDVANHRRPPGANLDRDTVEARATFDEAEADLREARARYTDAASRLSQQRARDAYLADQAAQAAARAEQRAQSRESTMRRTLSRIRTRS